MVEETITNRDPVLELAAALTDAHASVQSEIEGLDEIEADRAVPFLPAAYVRAERVSESA
jgi:hypothetical protein